MKISLTLFLFTLMLFIVSCTSMPSENKNYINMSLAIKTSNKNKELIVESLFEENMPFSVYFNDSSSYELSNDLINSKMKHFCNSIIEDENNLIEFEVFKSDKNENKKILVIYSDSYKEFVSSLEEKYPKELFFSVNESNYEQKIAEILNTILSLKNFEKVKTIDNSLKIEHTPRIRNDISKIYFVMDYDTGKTIVPEFKSYTLNIPLYTSSEIFHNAVDLKKLIDFEGSYVPISDQLIANIPVNTNSSIKYELEKLLIKDFLTIEKVHQNYMYSKNIKLNTSNGEIKKNSCVKRKLNFWKISTKDIANQI